MLRIYAPVLGVLVLVCAAATFGATPAKKAAWGQETVDGFKLSYGMIATPADDWGTDQEGTWVSGLSGTLHTEKPLSYRKQTLPPGQYDFWVEKGKGDWFYLFVGDRENEEAERLRAMFKLYEQESGVEKLEVKLKLTRRATKLKFSVLAGKSEGHGNFRIGSSGK